MEGIPHVGGPGCEVRQIRVEKGKSSGEIRNYFLEEDATRLDLESATGHGKSEGWQSRQGPRVSRGIKVGKEKLCDWAGCGVCSTSSVLITLHGRSHHTEP